MSQVSSTSALDSYTGAGDITSAAGGNSDLDKEAFLTLLITQFQYQDPLNPMEDKEFIAQLAQFSSLEQSMEMNDKMEAMTASINHQTTISITSYIGKEVSARGYGISKEGSQTSLVQYAGSEAMASCVANVVDSNGQLVASVDLGDKASGIHDFTWNGMTTSGGEAPDGVYTVNFVAKNADGDAVFVDTSVSGRVTGTSYYNGEYYLRMANGTSVNLAEVREVVEATPAIEGKYITGTDGNDYLEGTVSDDSILAGGGDDIIVYDSKDQNVDGGSGFDFLIADGEISTNAKNYEAVIRGTDAMEITSVGDLEDMGLNFFEGKIDVSNATWLENWTDQGNGQWTHNEKLITVEIMPGQSASPNSSTDINQTAAISDNIQSNIQNMLNSIQG